ncbi:hypothetical protein M0R72_07495 [Candidatus Pacearchaeota archaeon]|jgi:hypothetical protein|nr:hypothetical protein [Candidatus Pacearchaeota archaeon]
MADKTLNEGSKPLRYILYGMNHQEIGQGKLKLDEKISIPDAGSISFVLGAQNTPSISISEWGYSTLKAEPEAEARLREEQNDQE